MGEIAPETVFNPDESDLQPLAAMPEFKAMKEKMKENAGEAKTEETQQEKTDKQKSAKP